MDFSQYQEEAKKTASYKDADYLPLGLAEECGELVHEFARCKRKGVPMDLDNLKSEIGDVLWMLAMISEEHGFTLEDAAYDNIVKLRMRTSQGSIHEKEGRDSLSTEELDDAARCGFLRGYNDV